MRTGNVGIDVGNVIRLKRIGPMPGGDGHHLPCGLPSRSEKTVFVTGSVMMPLPISAKVVGCGGAGSGG